VCIIAQFLHQSFWLMLASSVTPTDVVCININGSGFLSSAGYRLPTCRSDISDRHVRHEFHTRLMRVTRHEPSSPGGTPAGGKMVISPAGMCMHILSGRRKLSFSQSQTVRKFSHAHWHCLDKHKWFWDGMLPGFLSSAGYRPDLPAGKSTRGASTKRWSMRFGARMRQPRRSHQIVRRRRDRLGTTRSSGLWSKWRQLKRRQTKTATKVYCNYCNWEHKTQVKTATAKT